MNGPPWCFAQTVEMHAVQTVGGEPNVSEIWTRWREFVVSWRNAGKTPQKKIQSCALERVTKKL